jgi:sirohydrochlorin cobaltochelatase
VAIERLVQSLSSPAQPILGQVMLECAPEPLHGQLAQMVGLARARGYGELRLVPLFLLPGVHVMEDIPAEVALVAGGDVVVTIAPFLGQLPSLNSFLGNISWGLDPGANAPRSRRILMSHGSRRAGGNDAVEALARALGFAIAYWSVEPKLETVVRGLVEDGVMGISLLPFFLTAGGITDAIAVEFGRLQGQLQDRFPGVEFRGEPPLDRQPGFSDVVLELLN